MFQKWIQSRSIQLKGYGHCAACACSACTQVCYWKLKSIFSRDPIGSMDGILDFRKKNYRLQLMNIDETGVDCSWISWFPGFMNGSGNGALNLQTWMYLYKETSTLHGAGSLGRSGKCLPKENIDLVFLMKTYQ